MMNLENLQMGSFMTPFDGTSYSCNILRYLAASLAAHHGPIPMAAFQICLQLWLTTSLVADGLAVAGQAILARAFTKDDKKKVAAAAARVLQLSIVLGVFLTSLLGVGMQFGSGIFTKNADVLKIVHKAIPFVAGTQPINALAFVFDGVNFGASDYAFSAYSMEWNKDLSQKLESQTQRLELLTAQRMANENALSKPTEIPSMHDTPVYADEGDEGPWTSKRRIGEATALEVRATGIPYVFAPCIVVCRDIRWGRCYESYSEDTKVVQQMTEIIPGLQGESSSKGVPFVAGKKRVAACAKHFVGDGGTQEKFCLWIDCAYWREVLERETHLE